MGLPPRRHFLHAAWLTFRHPVSGEVLDLRSPLPPDLRTSVEMVASGAGDPASGRPGRERGSDVLVDVGFYERDG